MRVKEHPKSPLPSVSRLLPNINIHISRHNMPNMSTIYGKSYQHDEPLLGNERPLDDTHQNSLHKHRKLLDPDLIRKNLYQVKNMKPYNLSSKIRKPIRQPGFTATDSRDDELEEAYLLSRSSQVFRMSDLRVKEREMPTLAGEIVDFGGFESEKVVEEETVSISDGTSNLRDEDFSIDSRDHSRIYAQITRGVWDESDEESKSMTVSECDKSSRECGAESPSTNDLSESYFRSVKSAKEMNYTSPSCFPDKHSVSKISIANVFKSKNQMNEVCQINAEETPVGSATITSSSYPKEVSLTKYEMTTEPTNSVKGVNDAQQFSSFANESVVTSSTPPFVLYGVEYVNKIQSDNKVKVLTQNQSDSNAGDDSLYSSKQNIIDQDVGADVHKSSMQNPSSYTPDPSKLLTIPTVTFSTDSPSDDRKFLVKEKRRAVTPTEHRDVIVISDFDRVSSITGDSSRQSVLNTRTDIDLKTKFLPSLKANGCVQSKAEQVCKDVPALVSVSSQESVSTISKKSTSKLSFSDVKFRKFEDKVSNAQYANETEFSDFKCRDDWKPQDDSDSVCSEQFGCCTINVDVKHSILNGSEKVIQTAAARDNFGTQRDDNGNISPQLFSECTDPVEVDLDPKAPERLKLLDELSPPNTPTYRNRFIEELSVAHTVYPEINMLNLSDDDSEYSSSDSSSEFKLFHLNDRFKESDEVFESDAIEEVLDESRCTSAEKEDYNTVNEIQEKLSDDASCVDTITLNESTLMPTTTSDRNLVNFDSLERLFKYEWMTAAHERAETSADFHESLATDSESPIGHAVQDSGVFKYVDIDDPSIGKRTLLEPVEEVGESEEDMSTSSSNSGEEATSVKGDKGIHLLAEKESEESSDSSTVADDDQYIGDFMTYPRLQTKLTFHVSRRTKKQCLRVKKWAVVKAKSNTAAKFHLDRITREYRAKNCDNKTLKNVHSNIAPPPEVDKVVKTALQLIAKRVSAEDQHIEWNIENNKPPDQLKKCHASYRTELDAHIISQTKTTDCLGQLVKYLSPKAQEGRLGVVQNLEVPMSNIKDQPTSSILTEDSLVQTKTTITISDDTSDNEKEHDENTYGEGGTELRQNQCKKIHIGENQKDAIDAQIGSRLPLMQFDEVHLPEMGTLTQKLYYTNTELAEVLAITQTQLEVAKRRAETLTMERDSLLATAAECRSEVIRANEEYELITWLEEKNELID